MKRRIWAISRRGCWASPEWVSAGMGWEGGRWRWRRTLLEDRSNDFVLSCLVLSRRSTRSVADLSFLPFPYFLEAWRSGARHGTPSQYITYIASYLFIYSIPYPTMRPTKHYIPKLSSFSSSITDTANNANETTTHEPEPKPNRQAPISSDSDPNLNPDQEPKQPQTPPASRSRTYRLAGSIPAA